MLYIEITNSVNNRRVIVNIDEGVLRIEELANGRALFQFQGSTVTSLETYLVIREKMLPWFR